MKKRCTEEQIVGILREAETGASVASICRQYGIAEATFHRWRQKCQGMAESELRRLVFLTVEEGTTRRRRFESGGGDPPQPATPGRSRPCPRPGA